MIDFQSVLTDVAELPSINQRSTAGILPPGGSNERSECHFLCCSDVGWGLSRQSAAMADEGELKHRGRQSAPICLSYRRSVPIGVHPWLNSSRTLASAPCHASLAPSREKLPQINLSEFKYQPNTGRYRPKSESAIASIVSIPQQPIKPLFRQKLTKVR
jgi:hypothetical protein